MTSIKFLHGVIENFRDPKSSMRGEIEKHNIAALVRRYARLFGLILELEPNSGALTIIAREIQTGVRLTDLPGMEETGCWQSWPDCLSGLSKSRERR